MDESQVEKRVSAAMYFSIAHEVKRFHFDPVLE